MDMVSRVFDEIMETNSSTKVWLPRITSAFNVRKRYPDATVSASVISEQGMKGDEARLQTDGLGDRVPGLFIGVLNPPTGPLDGGVNGQRGIVDCTGLFCGTEKFLKVGWLG